MKDFIPLNLLCFLGLRTSTLNASGFGSHIGTPSGEPYRKQTVHDKKSNTFLWAHGHVHI